MNSILLLKFIAPLQAYGSGKMQYYGYKNTQDHPTKSAVIGLVSSALGYPRGDKRITVLNKELKISTRIDQKGTLMTDYQTTKSGSGKPSESYISHKQYIQDAIFLVAIESKDRVLVEKIREAIKKPKWSLALGKRNCVPSEPLLEGDIIEGKSVAEVFKEYKWLAKSWYRQSHMITSLDAYYDDLKGTLVQDIYNTVTNKFEYRFEKKEAIILKEFKVNISFSEQLFEDL